MSDLQSKRQRQSFSRPLVFVQRQKCKGSEQGYLSDMAHANHVRGKSWDPGDSRDEYRYAPPTRVSDIAAAISEQRATFVHRASAVQSYFPWLTLWTRGAPGACWDEVTWRPLDETWRTEEAVREARVRVMLRAPSITQWASL